MHIAPLFAEYSLWQPATRPVDLYLPLVLAFLLTVAIGFPQGIAVAQPPLPGNTARSSSEERGRLFDLYTSAVDRLLEVYSDDYAALMALDFPLDVSPSGGQVWTWPREGQPSRQITDPAELAAIKMSLRQRLAQARERARNLENAP